MTPDDLDIILARALPVLEDAVAKSIELNVNGKIRSMREVVDEIKNMNLDQNKKIDEHADIMDEHNKRHEKDMEELKPIVEAWKKAKNVEEGLDLLSSIISGILKKVAWVVGSLVTIVGGYIYLTHLDK